MSERDSANADVSALSRSRIFRDYQQAFTAASGLPLSLRHGELNELPTNEAVGSPFCALMAKTSPACKECLALQQQLAREARLETKKRKCFAGLCESAAPVRVGERLIAFLHTGHVLTEKPTKARFNRIATQLLAWGVQVDLDLFASDAAFAWYTRILTRSNLQDHL